MFKPRYIVGCSICKKRPLGQWREYDLYFCKSGPLDDYNWMAYKQDAREVGAGSITGHSTVSVRHNYKEDKHYLILSFIGFLINEEILK